jgi:adenylate cyclase class 2
MKDETEVKVRIDSADLEGIRKAILEIGFQPLSPSTYEENLMFDFPTQTLEKSGCALRLRKYGEKSTLTYKGPKKQDLHMKIRQEIETQVENFDATRQLLQAVGLHASFEYAKWRQKFELGQEPERVELCIDETPIGVFVEIEGESDAINRIAELLGWDKSTYVTSNYVDLYREADGYGT